MSQATLPPSTLGTNHVPSEEEDHLIRSLISIHQEKALALDAKIEQARVALKALELEKQIQDELLKEHKALLTPMRRLIPDVLLEIFHHCHQAARDSPMRLAMVCKRWRELALSTPALWTVVSLRDATPTKRVVPFAQACAKNSGSRSLRIMITVMNRRTDTQTMRKALLEAWGILTQHVHRWQSFELLVHQVYKPDDDTMTFAEAAPRLEKLTMLSGTSGIPLPFSIFPSLRDLRLSILQAKDVAVLLRCTMLKNLHIDSPSSGPTLVDCWTIFANCPYIETFNVPGIRFSNVIPKESLILPCLRELRIGTLTQDPAPLIHCIKAPVLKQLYLLVREGQGFDSSCLPRFVYDCRPPLTDLSLTGIDGSDLASCLPLLPSLTTLVLQQASAVDVVLHHLTVSSGTGGLLCPGLVHLGFQLCLFTGSRLIKLARVRRETAGGLRVLIGDHTSRYRGGEFKGLTIKMHLVEEFSNAELEELRGLQTWKEIYERPHRISVGRARDT